MMPRRRRDVLAFAVTSSPLLHPYYSDFNADDFALFSPLIHQDHNR